MYCQGFSLAYYFRLYLILGKCKEKKIGEKKKDIREEDIRFSFFVYGKIKGK